MLSLFLKFWFLLFWRAATLILSLCLIIWICIISLPLLLFLNIMLLRVHVTLPRSILLNIFSVSSKLGCELLVLISSMLDLMFGINFLSSLCFIILSIRKIYTVVLLQPEPCSLHSSFNQTSVLCTLSLFIDRRSVLCTRSSSARTLPPASFYFSQDSASCFPLQLELLRGLRSHSPLHHLHYNTFGVSLGPNNRLLFLCSRCSSSHHGLSIPVSLFLHTHSLLLRLSLRWPTGTTLLPFHLHLLNSLHYLGSYQQHPLHQFIAAHLILSHFISYRVPLISSPLFSDWAVPWPPFPIQPITLSFQQPCIFPSLIPSSSRTAASYFIRFLHHLRLSSHASVLLFKCLSSSKFFFCSGRPPLLFYCTDSLIHTFMTSLFITVTVTVSVLIRFETA